ncbi:hypothetical protein LWI28_025850 [Acer negundo]|uniref:Uncharacterized protein n=1 Tax=Acer negundo TaxID=4023 RepID=A0AAD5I7J9_ACENE|nr:hypothetical protein LWI28_025850 [Acer negundo]
MFLTLHAIDYCHVISSFRLHNFSLGIFLAHATPVAFTAVATSVRKLSWQLFDHYGFSQQMAHRFASSAYRCGSHSRRHIALLTLLVLRPSLWIPLWLWKRHLYSSWSFFIYPGNSRKFRDEQE